MGLKGELMRSGVGSVAVMIAGTLVNVALAIALARLLGAEGFGEDRNKRQPQLTKAPG